MDGVDVGFFCKLAYKKTCIYDIKRRSLNLRKKGGVSVFVQASIMPSVMLLKKIFTFLLECFAINLTTYASLALTGSEIGQLRRRCWST